MALVITPSSGAGALTYADATAGFTGSSGYWWLGKGRPDVAKHRTERHPAPAQDGNPVKRDGFDERSISDLEVVLVGASADAVWQAWKEDADAIAGFACSVAFGGNTFPACEVERFEVTKGPKKTSQGGMYRMHAVLGFKQLRTA